MEEEFLPLPPAEEEEFAPLPPEGEAPGTTATITFTQAQTLPATIPAPEGENLLAAFGPDFQREIISLMVHNHPFLKRNAPYLQKEFFQNKTHRTFAKIILDLHHRFPEEPVTWNMVAHEFVKRQPELGIKPDEMKLYMETMQKLIPPPVNPSYIEEEVQQFTATKALEVAIAGSLDLLIKGNREGIVESITNAAMLKKTQVTTVEPITITEGMEGFLSRLRDPEDLGAKNGIPTGFGGLDNVLMSGGVDRGEMIVVCGPPGRGKTPWMINCASNMTMRGYNVLGYTLEVSSKIYRMRHLSCLTGIQMVDLIPKVDDLEKRWNKLRAARKFGEWFLYDYPSRQLKPSMIRAHLRWYADHGIRIDAVVVDYADIMASDKAISLENRRMEYGDVYEELRAIAKEFNVALFTGSQGNRKSLNHIKVDLDDLSEDFSKAMTADYVIGLNQPKQYALLRPHGTNYFGTGLLCQFIAKNRNERRGQSIIGWSDFTRMRVCAHDWIIHDHELFGEPIRNLPMDNPDTVPDTEQPMPAPLGAPAPFAGAPGMLAAPEIPTASPPNPGMSELTNVLGNIWETKGTGNA